MVIAKLSGKTDKHGMEEEDYYSDEDYNEDDEDEYEEDDGNEPFKWLSLLFRIDIIRDVTIITNHIIYI